MKTLTTTSYLAPVQAGETLVIVDAGLPVAEVRLMELRPVGLRPYGPAAGEFRVPDDFDAALPEEVLASFEAQCGDSPRRFSEGARDGR
jgi:antitoxin (DNA-binding transcriptional repressor) of toxin-antitoxin stability system